MQHLALALYKHLQICTLQCIKNYCLTALLEYIDLFILDVVSISQNEYCTSNKDLQNILEVEPTFSTAPLQLHYDMMMNDE